MSHIVTIETEVRDLGGLVAACRRLGLDEPIHRTAKLFRSVVTGHCVELPDWRYPVVCQLNTGKLQYDNFSGHWGEQSQLDSLMQAYAVEVTKLEARRQGHTVTEQPLADGSIKLVVQLGEQS